ncbi:MAG: hypothetical protein EBZ59_12395, partial [Planctomycetia bacterium]|nr:hypothetical protein [Planctomycetia bacterium]
VTVGGNLSKDTYTVKAALPEGMTPAAFRLEAIADPSLPGQGPGRSGNGNFVVSTFAVMAGPRGSKETPSPVKLSTARADYEQGGYGVAGAIDDKPETGWSVGGGTGKPHEATFEVAADSKPPAGGSLAIILDQQYADGTHALGRFRVSVTASKPEAVKPAGADAKK